ncbi:hypothetical protein B0A54_10067 [Friedmanniomyces endolithicus]|uniref:Uncharacterized protein n=1 Tax=Friedmanniomyces endolithicus TaxID=329885 RepID=A0A4U0UTU9_9PEZI|nr:hypothetical protein B0A54_10067 [Friedmanniomyces endolithicus]
MQLCPWIRPCHVPLVVLAGFEAERVHTTKARQIKEDPVRSPVLKLRSGRSVLHWVTMGEYLLLYVLLFGRERTTTKTNVFAALDQERNDSNKISTNKKLFPYRIRLAVIA